MRQKPEEKGAAGTLADEAYRRVKELLVQKNLVGGQRLIYRDLTDALNMSRTPIITALNRLEREGFVAAEPFRGFHVKPINAKETKDLWGVREALEVYAVQEAIRCITPEGLVDLRRKAEIHANYTPGYYNPKKIMLDSDFHLQIAAITGNEVLLKHLRSNFEHQYIRYQLHELNVMRMGSAADEHRLLIQAIETQDASGAADIMRKHIRVGRDNVLAALGSPLWTRED